MRGCATGLLVLVLVAALLAGVAYVLLGQTPPGAAVATPIPVSTTAVQSFDRKIATVQQASGPVTVEITEQEATSKLQETLATDPEAPKFDNAQIAFRDGKMHLSGTERETPIPVTILVIGQIEARNGQLVAVVEQVDTGRAPLPDAFKEQIVSTLSDLETLNKYLAIFVTDARVVDGHLALTGHPK